MIPIKFRFICPSGFRVLLARRAYSWLFQLAQMWKLLAPGVGLGDFLTSELVPITINVLSSNPTYGEVYLKILYQYLINNLNTICWR
jgi:hypothetical protein